MIKTLLFSCVFAFSFLAIAKAPVPHGYTFMDEGFYKEQLNESMKTSSGRKLAQSDRVDYATAFGDDFKNLSSDLIGGSIWENGVKTSRAVAGIKSDADLAVIVDRYDADANFKGLSNQAKWVASQLAALKPWRGFLTRARPLIENSNSPFVHSFIIGWLRSVNQGINVFVPTPQWEAGFDYIARPYVGMKDDIRTDLDLFMFVRDEVLPSLIKFSTRLDALAYIKDASGKQTVNPDFKPFYFDNKLIYSTSKIVDEQDRFVVLDRAELHGLLSGVNLSISSLYVSLGYNWDGLLSTVNKMANVMGFNSMISNDPDKMTAEKRVQRFRQSGKLFTLLPKNKDLPEGGAMWTRAAYPWFKEGVRHGRLAWTITKKNDQTANGQFPLLDPRAFVPFSRIMDTSYEDISRLVNGEGVQSSLINGEEVQVNFREIFQNPPQDLKALLATGFEQGSKNIKDAKTGKTYRNYKYGNPKTWNLNVYRPYFPDIDQKNVPDAARIISQSWGASILSAGFLPVLF